jgi:hypothetical protein
VRLEPLYAPADFAVNVGICGQKARRLPPSASRTIAGLNGRHRRIAAAWADIRIDESSRAFRYALGSPLTHISLSGVGVMR